MAIKYVGPNALKKLCSLVKTALAGKINTSDIVQTTSATGSTKVPSADVTNDLQDQVDELNTNLSSLITTRSYGLPGVAVNAYTTSDYVFDIGMANYTPLGIITAWISAGYQCTIVGTAISESTATVRILNAYNTTRTPSDVWITVLYKHS